MPTASRPFHNPSGLAAHLLALAGLALGFVVGVALLVEGTLDLTLPS